MFDSSDADIRTGFLVTEYNQLNKSKKYENEMIISQWNLSLPDDFCPNQSQCLHLPSSLLFSLEYAAIDITTTKKHLAIFRLDFFYHKNNDKKCNTYVFWSRITVRWRCSCLLFWHFCAMNFQKYLQTKQIRLWILHKYFVKKHKQNKFDECLMVLRVSKWKKTFV